MSNKREVRKSIIVAAVLVAVVATVGSHLADKWTIAEQNETVVEQLNGGHPEMVTMHTTNNALALLRISIWPVAVLVIVGLAVSEIRRIRREGRNKEEENRGTDYTRRQGE